MGPTAAGKTALSLQLADYFQCEIVSVDSALIYRNMNIGTAKPSSEILNQYPHHLINIVSPTDSYSVASFRQQALELVDQITARKKIPLFVGGTMLYFNALEKGLSDLPESDPTIRQALQAELENTGPNGLHDQLATVDPVSAARIHKNDPQRIMRALEVWKITGRTLTELHSENKSDNAGVDALKICISCEDRSLLHRRIASRFDQMLGNGFIEEVEELRNKYISLTSDMPSMRSVGYRQVWQYLDNCYDKKELVEKGVVATRQLAKRQLTWLRSMKDVNWFDSDADPLAKVISLVRSRFI